MHLMLINELVIYRLTHFEIPQLNFDIKKKRRERCIKQSVTCEIDYYYVKKLLDFNANNHSSRKKYALMIS